MILTVEEQAMFDGAQGPAKQKAMEILVGLGECFDAEKMLPIRSTHLVGNALVVAGAGKRSGRIEFMRELSSLDGKFETYADLNPSSHDSKLWEYLGIDPEFVQESEAQIQRYMDMGAQGCSTCTPYLIGHLPKFGEHVAWGESSAIIFVNSVIGARTNREGAPSALAAALTGRTPAYGFHLDENRHGDLKVIVDTKLEGTWDFGTLGYFAGKRAGIRTPVYTGMAKEISWDQFKILGAAAANSGGCAMYHVVGATPEAPTEEAAFGNQNPKDVETYVFGEKELRETEEFLDKSKVREVDIVVLGCPNASIEEIKVAASMLDGKRLNSGAQLWVFTNQVMKAEADKAGLTDIIEASGAKIVVGSCTATMPKNLLANRGFKGAATNSAKMVFFLQGQQGLASHYGSTTRCVQAAISGVWS